MQIFYKELVKRGNNGMRERRNDETTTKQWNSRTMEQQLNEPQTNNNENNNNDDDNTLAPFKPLEVLTGNFSWADCPTQLSPSTDCHRRVCIHWNFSCGYFPPPTW